MHGKRKTQTPVRMPLYILQQSFRKSYCLVAFKHLAMLLKCRDCFSQKVVVKNQLENENPNLIYPKFQTTGRPRLTSGMQIENCKQKGP
jgi:hypothetical protein